MDLSKIEFHSSALLERPPRKKNESFNLEVREGHCCPIVRLCRPFLECPGYLCGKQNDFFK